MNKFRSNGQIKRPRNSASGNGPVKITRTDSVPVLRMNKFGTKKSEKPKREFRSFHADVLDAYADWMKREHDVDVKIIEKYEQPEFGAILSGQVDAMVESDAGNWPLMIKTVYQAPNANPKSVEEIMQGRDNSYLDQDEDGNWYVKKSSTVWYACQNMLALCNFGAMYLIVYNQRNLDFLTVEVSFDKEAFTGALKELNDFLNENVSAL